MDEEDKGGIDYTGRERLTSTVDRGAWGREEETRRGRDETTILHVQV